LHGAFAIRRKACIRPFAVALIYFANDIDRDAIARHLGAAVRHRHISGNNTPDAAIPDKHQDRIGAKSTSVIEKGTLQ
jgi:hypothetical protein